MSYSWRDNVKKADDENGRKKMTAAYK